MTEDNDGSWIVDDSSDVPPPQHRKTEICGFLSLISAGISLLAIPVGLICCAALPLPFAVIAAGLGIVSIIRCKSDPYSFNNMWMGIVGTVIGGIFVLLAIAGGIVLISIAATKQ